MRFTVVGGRGATIQVRRVQVCVGWSSNPAALADVGTSHVLLSAPIVRSIRTDTVGALFGATVPDLPTAPTLWWPQRLGEGTDMSYTAGDTVPVADMVMRVTLDDASVATVLIPVGVTDLAYALVVLAALALGCSFLALRLAFRRPAARRDLVLYLVRSSDGRASLSQFQILLWTAAMAVSATYVMILSGNLIPLSSGTLVLLGISGGAALAACMPSSAPRRVGDGPKAGPPAWSDLVVVDGDLDLTRVQMLAFTLLSAALVLFKVAVGYVIPNVPPNFLLLMGISNGIYVAGRRFPGRRGPACRRRAGDRPRRGPGPSGA